MIVYASRGEIMARVPALALERRRYYNIIYRLPLVPDGYVGDLTDHYRRDPIYRCDMLTEALERKIARSKMVRARTAARNLLRIVREICEEKRKESA